jgi:hypothetical protein
MYICLSCGGGCYAGFGHITLKLKEMYQMITLGGDAELELVDSLDPFSEGIVFSGSLNAFIYGGQLRISISRLLNCLFFSLSRCLTP